MAVPRRVTVTTVPTPLVEEGLTAGGGFITVAMKSATLFYVGEKDTVTVDDGWSIPANQPIARTPTPDVENLWGVVASGTAVVEVWPSGPGL